MILIGISQCSDIDAYAMFALLEKFAVFGSLNLTNGSLFWWSDLNM